MNSRLSIIGSRICVIVVCNLHVELVSHLNDAGNMPGKRMQQLPLVERWDNARKRHHPTAGQNTQLSAAGQLSLLNE
jgi:hypothetical protein